MGGHATAATAGRISAASWRRRLLRPSHRFLSASVSLRSSFSRNYTRSAVFIASKRIFFFHNFLSFSSSTSSSTYKQSERIMDKSTSLSITNLEQTIFDTLKAVLVHFQLNTQLRVAGGWVRDKLLGKECHDIDIALEDMMGKVFCDKVNDYLSSINETTCNVSVIQSNPDQSKHLETAKMKIYGVEIDFVNLRAETYAENSRIPVMTFGTPEEDSLRRDLTINSLFYNINTGSVEDFTGRGLADLRNGIIATPLPPKTTFLDDPLRVLRAIRFAARFDFKIQEDLKQAAADADVKVALSNKVSPERVGTEIDLMMKGANPTRAIRELVDMDLFWIVFRLPQELNISIPDDVKWACLISLDAMCKVLPLFGSPKLTEEQRRIGRYAALLLPLRDVSYKDRKNKEIQLTRTILRDSLKLRANDGDMVVSLHKAAQELQSLFKVLFEEEQDEAEDVEAEDWEVLLESRKRIRAGLWIDKIQKMWRVAILLRCIMEPSLSTDCREQSLKEKAERCLAAEEAVLELGLENIWSVKPLLDGKEIMTELGLNKGGPEIKGWQTQVRKWQLCHLSGTQEACLEWFRDQCRMKRRRSS